MAIFNITANGSLTNPFRHRGTVRKGYLQVIVSAGGPSETLGGGTVEIQKEFPDGIFRTIPNASFGAEVSKIIDMEDDTDIQVLVSGATSPDFIVELI